MLETSGDVSDLAESLHGLGENLMLQGRFQEGLRWLAESAELSERLGNRSLAGENRYMIAMTRWISGDYAAAQADVERSAGTLTEIGDAWNSSFALHIAARVALTRGEFGAALQYAARGLSLARQIGAVRAIVRNLLSLSMVHRELEDFHGAWQADLEAADLVRAGEVGAFNRPTVLAALALDAAALGRTDDAVRFVDEAKRVLNSGQTRLDYPQEVAHAEAQIWVLLGKAAEAGRAAMNLVKMADAFGTLHWRVPGLLVQADATSVSGDLESAASTYRTAAEEAERLGRDPALWRALAGLAEAQRALGDATAAAAAAARAREIIDRLAATVPDERLRAVFLQSPKVQRVGALASG